MRLFFDTSVLVAASERSHPHHERALPLLQRVAKGEDAGVMSAHSLAEVYAAEAQRIVTENILPHFEIVTLTREDYTAVIQDMGARGIPGARIYDALLLRCAAHSAADRILTFNQRFNFLAMHPKSTNQRRA